MQSLKSFSKLKQRKGLVKQSTGFLLHIYPITVTDEFPLPGPTEPVRIQIRYVYCNITFNASCEVSDFCYQHIETGPTPIPDFGTLLDLATKSV